MLYQDCRKIVLKIGSALIAPSGDGCSAQYTLPIARFIHQCQMDGKLVILVSSGSVAAGRKYIKQAGNNPSLAQKQAMAAVGQNAMMSNWKRFFDKPCAQILVTHADLQNRESYLNIRNTINELLDNNILPIVNENDSVATEELKVGDNDRLAAMIAILSQADVLMIGSDVDGLYTADPNIHPEATKIVQVDRINDDIFAKAGGTTNHLATGGMKTKLEAAIKATTNGIDTFLFKGSKSQNFEKFVAGKSIGTRFIANSEQLTARKHWVKHTLTSKGEIKIDLGAVNAIESNGASLLSVGIRSISGRFDKGEAADIICDETNRLIARGICQYNHTAIEQIKGIPSEQFESILGYFDSDVVIERDDLVLMSDQSK
ncbi:MAG: glutamate 5-kinase [Kangiellaceae bacterium]|nr:glutamate 5-kinase [Kangiellaceae bacterium]